ncbi:MAG: hypothetical protein QOG91_212 [Candidatus Parcubacteria bacterium]|nr:hypothetical protein [Candidatus Parcubacteria bacterium]
MSFVILSALLLLIAAISVSPGRALAEAVNCPPGFICAPIVAVPGCPVGYTCTPINANVSSAAPFPRNAPSSCYALPADLQIGGTGTTVSDLQVWLVGNGFDIPAISSGKAARGYYGNQTAAAVAKYRMSQKYQICFVPIQTPAQVPVTIAPLAPSVLATPMGISALSTTYGSKSCTGDLSSCTQAFSFTYALTAGNNAIYVSKDPAVALSTSANPNGFTITSQDFSDSDGNGDGSDYFYVGPAQTKTFTARFQAFASGASSGIFEVNSLNYGISPSDMNMHWPSQDVPSALKAILFN